MSCDYGLTDVGERRGMMRVWWGMQQLDTARLDHNLKVSQRKQKQYSTKPSTLPSFSLILIALSRLQLLVQENRWLPSKLNPSLKISSMSAFSNTMTLWDLAVVQQFSNMDLQKTTSRAMRLGQGKVVLEDLCEVRSHWWCSSFEKSMIWRMPTVLL